jgi:ATP phosphoribosyltransferase regulatory subunit
MARWLLPENFADSLPSEARAIEDLRRNLLDLYRSYGYELVAPPLIEYLDSLLSGTGTDLDLQTFKLVDQMSGRTLGLRSDMTVQVARIDAHLLNRQGVARLCYSGSVVHTRPSGFFASREPLQVGAELYGHAGVEADIEVMELMLASLKAAGAESIRVDLNHPAIINSLMLDAGIDAEQEIIFALLQAKDAPGLQAATQSYPRELASALVALTQLYGPLVGHAGEGEPMNTLARARQLLPNTPAVTNALDQLQHLCHAPQLSRFSGVTLAVDLADVRGYRYHNGITFSAWVPQLANAIARGGRYDNIGAAFGRARPATGFSLELREMAQLWSGSGASQSRAIAAPWSDDASLAQEVAKLRVAGEIVVQVLPGHQLDQQEFVFDRELKFIDSKNHSQSNNGTHGVWTVAKRDV